MNPLVFIAILAVSLSIVAITMNLNDSNSISDNPFDEFEEKSLDSITTIKEIKDIASLETSIPKQGKITYAVESLPDIPDEKIPRQAIKHAIQNWEENNPQLDFQEAHTDADFQIIWREIENPEYAGLAHSGLVSTDLIEIGLGSVDCNGEYLQYDINALTNTIMHEIGHLLGLEHTRDETHLMYGLDKYTEIEFDNHGFVVPELLDGFYVGYVGLENKVSELNSEIVLREKRYDELYVEFANLKSQYSEDSDLEQIDLLRIEDELNAYVYETNALIVQHNKIIDLMSCYPNVIQD